jgi:hypothetical protein
MNPKLYAIGLALGLTLAGCGRETQEAATLEPPREGSGTTISSSTDPATASQEPPAVTASSAAAAAPECKDMKEADPATCQPEAQGDPAAK